MGIVASVDHWQRRHALGGLPVAVLKKFGEDRASSLAALVAYYAFFSLFPLALALVSILGFVLDDNPSLRDDVIDSAFGRIPVIGAELAGRVHPLTGSPIALAVGVVGALWAGLGVTVALGRAFAEIWDTPRFEQPGGFRARARGLAVLAILGVTLIASTAVAGLGLGGEISPTAERGAAIAGAIAVNAIVLLTVFAVLTPRPWHVRDLLPGVAMGAFAALVLQALGTWYVDRAVANASAIYGAFALVIGLLSWFWLASHVLLVSAEINVVLRWRLWPRALTGELEPADRVTMRRFAQAAQLDRRERIAVGFGHDGESPAGPE